MIMLSYSFLFFLLSLCFLFLLLIGHHFSEVAVSRAVIDCSCIHGVFDDSTSTCVTLTKDYTYFSDISIECSRLHLKSSLGK